MQTHIVYECHELASTVTSSWEDCNLSRVMKASQNVWQGAVTFAPTEVKAINLLLWKNVILRSKEQEVYPLARSTNNCTQVVNHQSIISDC